MKREDKQRNKHEQTDRRRQQTIMGHRQQQQTNKQLPGYREGRQEGEGQTIMRGTNYYDEGDKLL